MVGTIEEDEAACLDEEDGKTASTDRGSAEFNPFSVKSGGMLVRFGQSWLQRFKRYYGWRKRKQHGEGQAVDEQAVQRAQAALPSLLKDFPLETIFNMDETAVYYRQVGMCLTLFTF